MADAISISKLTKVTDSDGKKKWAVTLNIDGNVDRDIKKYIEKIKFQAKHSQNTVASCFVPMNYAERGPAGPSATGSSKLSYPMGTWDSSTTYKNTLTSSPFVYHGEKYYTLISDTGVDCKGKKPGTTEGNAYWSEMKNYSSIYVKFLMADHATFGSKNGSVFYNNFMYSQQGIDEDQNFRHYSEISDIDGVFYKPANSNVYKLTGKFTPNTSIDFYSGSISCNKMIEKFDNFYLFDINNTNNVVFNNTYFMDLKKSHNLNIMSRYIDISKVLNSSNTDETYYLARPGVVVLPKYEGGAEDGINIFINYPNCRPVGKTVYPAFNLIMAGASVNTDNSVYMDEAERRQFNTDRTWKMSGKYTNGSTWTFYYEYEEIFTYSDSGTTAPSIPTTGKTSSGNTDSTADGWVPDGWYRSESDVEKLMSPSKPYMWMAQRVRQKGDEEWTHKFGEYGYLTINNVSVRVDKTPIVWKILDCKAGQKTTTIKPATYSLETLAEGYVLVCADSDMFNASNYSKTNIVDNSRGENYWKFTYNADNFDDEDINRINNNMFVWKGYISKYILLTPGSKLKLKSHLVKERYISSSNASNDGYGTKIKDIKNKQGNVIGGVYERINGRQWVVENSDDFQPIPLHIKIDNFSNSNRSSYVKYENIHRHNNQINYLDSKYNTFVSLYESDMPFMDNENYVALGSTLLDFDFAANSNADYYQDFFMINRGGAFTHSVFYNSALKTFLKYRGKYNYPLVLELNIHPDSYTSTWDISNISANKAYNSTRIYRWGVLDNPYIHITSGNGSNLMAY